MSKIKNIIIYISVTIIVFASFKIPEILLEQENNDIEIEVYEKEKNKSKIDVEAEKIYLVKAIHDMENDDSTVSISPSGIEEYFTTVESINENIERTDLEKELKKLKEYNILKNFETTTDSDISISVINKFYKNSNSKYTINNISLENNNQKYELDIENKTKKILCVTLEKDNLYSNNKEEIMKNYIKYLDLYIIDDWKFVDNMLKSEKAQLVVAGFVDNENNYILSIHSSNRNFNTVIDVLR